MAFPSFHTFFVPIVHALRARGGSASIDELEEAVASASTLSEEQRSQLHGDGPQTEFSYRLAWARTYLKKGGALDNSERGVWHLTPAGYEMSDDQIREIKYQVQQHNREARAAVAAQTESDSDPEQDEVEDATLSWKERLLESLLAIDPSAFERLCQRVLRESGFVKVEVTGRSGDGGIDGTGVPRLNLLHFKFSSNRSAIGDQSALLLSATSAAQWWVVRIRGLLLRLERLRPTHERKPPVTALRLLIWWTGMAYANCLNR